MTYFSPKWSLLRTIGNSKIFNLTIAIPIIGYFILFNDEVVQRLELSEQIIGGAKHHGLSDSTLMKLFCIYFGFCFLAVGSIIYFIVCPQLIKLYKNAVEFTTAQLPIATDRKLKEFNATISNLGGQATGFIEAISRRVDKLILRMHEEAGGKYAAPDALKQEIEDLKEQRKSDAADIMSDLYQRQDVTFPPIRWAVFISYVVGFFFLAIPSTIMFFQVVTRGGELIQRLI